MQVTWAMPPMPMFTDKSTKVHRQSHPRGKGQGKSDASQFPGWVPLSLHHNKEITSFWWEGFAGRRRFKAGSDQSGGERQERGLNMEQGRGLWSPGEQGEAAVRGFKKKVAWDPLADCLFFPHGRASFSTTCPCFKLFCFLPLCCHILNLRQITSGATGSCVKMSGGNKKWG